MESLLVLLLVVLVNVLHRFIIVTLLLLLSVCRQLFVLLGALLFRCLLLASRTVFFITRWHILRQALQTEVRYIVRLPRSDLWSIDQQLEAVFRVETEIDLRIELLFTLQLSFLLR